MIQWMLAILSLVPLPFLGFPGGSDICCNVGDPASASGLGKSHGEGNGNALQYFCLENPMDRGACWATVWGCKESDMTE